MVPASARPVQTFHRRAFLVSIPNREVGMAEAIHRDVRNRHVEADLIAFGVT